MEFDKLTDELKAKAHECKDAEELAKLAEEEGIELSDEMFDAISGGGDWKETCGPNCAYVEPGDYWD